MKNNSSGGLGLASVLTIVFVVLKLVGTINWSWWWVLSPLWIDLILTILLIIGFVIYEMYDDKKFEKKYGISFKKKDDKK
jgi:hypothetical protein